MQQRVNEVVDYYFLQINRSIESFAVVMVYLLFFKYKNNLF